MKHTRTESFARRSGSIALTDSELMGMLRWVGRLEDDALLRLAVSSGMRREDVVSVQLKDVDLERGEITYWESKKKRRWRAYVAGETLKVLRLHMDKLPRGTPWLFPSSWDSKKHLSSRQAYNIFQKYLHMAGLKPRPFHALRATCIKLAQRRGWPVEKVMELTGDSFRTIKEHYDTPTPEEMAEVAREKPIL